MISVIIVSRDEEQGLAHSLSALVQAAVDGLVSEAIVVDVGAGQGTAMVADAAGCRLVRSADIAKGLHQAAAAARAPWLLFLSAGTVLDPSWERHATDFIQSAGFAGKNAALFRRSGYGIRPLLGDTLAALARWVGIPPSGGAVLLSGSFYAALGGHADAAADASRDLLRRIGPRRVRLVKLPNGRSAY